MQTQSVALVRSANRPAPAIESETLKIIGVARTYRRDQQIFGQGDAAEVVFKVVSGAVRTFRLLADGRRQIAEFYLPGDIFGVELGDERQSAAEAIGETTLIVARRGSLAADVDQRGLLWRHALEELHRSQDHVLTLGRRSAAERVASFLVDLADRTAAARELTLPMSRQDMADYLGLTIETVSRTMTQLQADGFIQVSGCRHVRLARPAALAELCE